jgi:hypothetical protein
MHDERLGRVGGRQRHWIPDTYWANWEAAAAQIQKRVKERNEF